jgi:hypothetical protein
MSVRERTGKCVFFGNGSSQLPIIIFRTKSAVTYSYLGHSLKISRKAFCESFDIYISIAFSRCNTRFRDNSALKSIPCRRYNHQD